MVARLAVLALLFASGLWAQGISSSSNAPIVNGGRFQSFEFDVTNTAGTMQHRIVADSDLTAAVPNLVSQISGASVTLTNSPALAVGVGFATGSGIDSTVTSRMIFNTNAQVAGTNAGICTVTLSTATGFIGCDIRIVSLNINGTTRNWLAVQFFDAAGARLVNTTNITAAQIVRTRIVAFIQ